jgi:tRNA threonylcarbamoyladenosine biosynthesis protein TsaE
VTQSPAETRRVGRALAAVLEADDVVLLAGPLGAGKTEFTKGIAEGLGIREPVVSPTFTLAREYPVHGQLHGEGGLRLLHVDLYRLDRGQEVIDLGLDDLAGDDAVTVVEWGDLAAGLFPADHLEVQLDPVLDTDRDTDSDQDRIISFTVSGVSWHGRQVALAAALAASQPSHLDVHDTPTD